MTRVAKQWATTGFIIGIASGFAILAIAFTLLQGTPDAIAAPVVKGPMLSGTINANVPAPAVVFVIARDAASKGHPVLAKRFEIASFPAPFVLSSADAMIDGNPPEAVTLEVRVDKDGDAMTKETDAPKAVLENVKLGSSVVVTLR